MVDQITKSRAERCTTHSHACDCREYEHAQEIERLRAEVKRLDAGWREAVEVANSYAEQFGVHERERDALRARAERAEGRIASAPIAIMDTRDALGLCAPTEEDFPSLYALQGKRVALVVVND